MNIRVDLNYPINDGTEVIFRSPVDCSEVTGLKVYYPEDGLTAAKEFVFADAHGNNVGDIDHLFAENVVVKVLLDVTTNMAFVQNADTNAYIEKTFIKKVNGIGPDKNGNVEIETGDITYQEIASVAITDDNILENYIVMASGKETFTDAFNCTDFLQLPFDEGSNLSVKCTIYGVAALVFYNESKEVVLGIDGNNASQYGITPAANIQEITIAMPENAKYIRLSAWKQSYLGASDLTVSGCITKNVIDSIKDIDKRTEMLASTTETVSVSISANDIIDGAFVYSNGSIQNSSVFVCTGLIPLEFDENTQVTLRCTIYGNAALAFYNVNGSFVSSVTSNNVTDYGIAPGIAMQEFSVIPPYDAKYVRMSAWKDSYSSPSDFVVKGQITTNIGTRVQGIEQTIKANITDFQKLKVLVLGDSISTDGYANYEKWVTKLIKQGFFSSRNVTNNSIHATGFLASLSGDGTDCFLPRLQAVQNPDEYDIVIIFGGVNDYIKAKPYADFTAAVDSFFEYLISTFINARICILRPLRVSSQSQTSEGKSQQDYSAYIGTVAKSYCLPVLNLTEESGFYPWIPAFKNRWTITNWTGGDGTTGDGVHPNEEWEETRLAPMIRAFLMGLI